MAQESKQIIGIHSR